MKTIYLIGIGKIGKTILQKAYESRINAKFVVISRTLKEENNNFSFPFKIINIDPLHNIGTTSFLNEIGSNNLLKEKYIFLAGLGGRSGSELLESLTVYFNSISTEYFSIGICPFKFEGKNRRKKAISYIHNLQTFPNFKYFDNNLIVEKYDGKINLAKAFEINDKEIVQFISNIAEQNRPNNISYN